MKKMIFVFILLIIIFSSISIIKVQASDNPCQKWDINFNDKNDLTDIIYGLQILSGVGSQADFIIKDVKYQANIINDGERENLAVHWEGNPKFPVTMIYRPRTGWDCPQGGCQVVQYEFTQVQNPLVGVDFQYCYGYSEGHYLDYEVLLKDADGRETEPKAAAFNCLLADTFSIKEVSYSENVINDGERENLTVIWEGNPKFPVTMIYRPRTGWDCPQGDCQVVQYEFTQVQNPLVGVDFQYCYGYSEGHYLDYEVLLKDADGRETEPKAAAFNCLLANTFSIKEVSYSENVINDGERENLTVQWEGNPKFPVTVIYRPRTGWDCPQGGCQVVQYEFTQVQNPFVGIDFQYCYGYSESHYLDYEVLLKDADGRETEPKAAAFNCTVIK